MLPKDLLVDLEKGDRTKEMLSKPEEFMNNPLTSFNQQNNDALRQQQFIPNSLVQNAQHITPQDYGQRFLGRI